MEPLIFIIIASIFIIILLLAFVLRSTAKEKGKRGERRVTDRLTYLSYKYEGKYINNLMLSVKDGSTQIDHIYIDRSGVYVIETKNYSGNVYGDDYSNKWTQVFNYGRTKSSLYNPVKQNEGHIKALKYKLRFIDFYNVVIFVQGNIFNIRSKHVYTLNSFEKLVKEKNDLPPVLDKDSIEKLYDKLINLSANGIISEKEHVSNIIHTQNMIKLNICPRCGAKLVIRTSKDGNKFYGCPNYPKCKFTKRINS